MSTKVVLATIVVLSLATGHAFADSDGNPFPFQATPLITHGPALVVDTGSEAYPAFTGNMAQPSALAQLEPAPGREGIVHTAASLPRGFGETAIMAARNSKLRTLEAGNARPTS